MSLSSEDRKVLKKILKQKLKDLSIILVGLLALLFFTIVFTFLAIQKLQSLPSEIGVYLQLSYYCATFYLIAWSMPIFIIYKRRQNIKEYFKEIYLLLKGKDPWEIKPLESEDLSQYF